MEAPILKNTDVIQYIRHEFHSEPEETQGDLFILVYDIPYFGACGVFPPLHVANQIFASGGGDGGMSPGASWEPFTVSNKQYNQLLNKVLKQSSISLKEKARYYHIQFIVDSSFDKYRDQFEWMQAVCNKHRKGYNLKLEKVQKHITNRYQGRS